jgi:hypothetical protein
MISSEEKRTKPTYGKGVDLDYNSNLATLNPTGKATQDRNFHACFHTLKLTLRFIRDDWMRDPLTQADTQNILEILYDVFGHSSTNVIAQMSVTAWLFSIPNSILVDAILDLLVCTAYRIQLLGESNRNFRSPIQRVPPT